MRRLVHIHIAGWVYIMICMCILRQLPCAAQEGVLADASYRARYDLAVGLNASRHYMEAYDSLRTLHRDVLRAFERHGKGAAEVADRGAFVFYLNTLISQAQCGYKVGLHSDMSAILYEMDDAINSRVALWPEEADDYDWHLGAYHKTMGDYYYVVGARDETLNYLAGYYYKYALDYYRKANSETDVRKVYADLAQLKYADRAYNDALQYMELATGTASEGRLVAGTNAEVSFVEDEMRAQEKEYRPALAMCQARMGQYRGALRTIEQSMAQLPPGSKQAAELKRMRAKILVLRNEATGADIEDAVALYEEYFRAIKDTVGGNFMQMTAEEREEYWTAERPFVVDCYGLERRTPALLYDVTLYNKGMLLQTARSFDNLLYDGTDGHPNERRQLNMLRQQDAANALENRPTTLAKDYEKQLLRTMAADGRRGAFFRPLDHTWRDVQRALPTGGCAIEFVEYEKHDFMHLGALVLRKKGAPEFVHIGRADSLLGYVGEEWTFNLEILIRSTSSAFKNAIYTDQPLRDMIWTRPLVEAIGKSRKVYFSADGMLHLLAIEYMLPKKLTGKSFYRLSSTRVLVDGHRIDAGKIRNGAALVLGGIYYDSFAEKDTIADPGNDAAAFKALQSEKMSMSYLKGAKKECDSIIHYRQNPSDLYLSGEEATEHRFYEECNKFPLLHISTHGIYNGQLSLSELWAAGSKDILSESCLMLSRANTNLRDQNFDAFNKDGILSAREVARLKLDNVELVTTSACQTALGYVTADGVYGMQRGFKSAGAKGLLTTLWSVNDESARIFFTALYRYMAQGESVHKAFTHARNDLLTKTYTAEYRMSLFSAIILGSQHTSAKKEVRYDTPQHSCPYVLIDVWD